MWKATIPNPPQRRSRDGCPCDPCDDFLLSTHPPYVTPRGFLSSRSATNFECRNLSPSVHSKNSMTATSLGRTQTHFFIFCLIVSHFVRRDDLVQRTNNRLCNFAQSTVFPVCVILLTLGTLSRFMRVVERLPFLVRINSNYANRGTWASNSRQT